VPDESVSDALSATLAQMGAVLFSEQTVDTLLELLVGLAVETSDIVDAASLTLRRGGSEETSNASSEVALAIDQAQYDSGRGPCVAASRTGEELVIDLEPHDPRWPEYADAALARGFRASASMPLMVGGQPTGALNAYSTSDSFSEDQLRPISMFRDQAAVLLANALAFNQAEVLNDNLRDALATRETIGQAKGILMATERMDPDAAFDLLRRASQRENRKLRDIAQEIVDRHSAPS
jgi:GAF domain-containing protein